MATLAGSENLSNKTIESSNSSIRKASTGEKFKFSFATSAVSNVDTIFASQSTVQRTLLLPDQDTDLIGSDTNDALGNKLADQPIRF